MFLAGNEILQSHDPKLVLLAAAICALGSFITLFLFAQAREDAWAGAERLAVPGRLLGRRRHVDHPLRRAARLSARHQHRLRPGADRRRLLRRGAPLHDRPRGRRLRPGPVGAGRRRHRRPRGRRRCTSRAWRACRSPARSRGIPTLLAMGAVLCITCGILAIGRARTEGRNVQFIAPILLAAGICIMHFVGMAAIDHHSGHDDPDPAEDDRSDHPRLLRRRP